MGPPITKRLSPQSNSCTACVWFAAHGIDGIVTDNDACYRANDFTHNLHGRASLSDRLYTRRHNEGVCYNRILAEEFLYAGTWTSEAKRAEALNASYI